jgi:zinc protease
MAIQSFTLDNGMQVLLEENHAAKVVSFNALVKVGSVNETDEEAGMSHLIEHMLFKGTPTRPTGVIARDVEAAGGDINAYTSLDQTVYYINMASRFAKQGLEILADAIQNPLFDDEELSREKEVVLEEVRREQDNPSRMTIEYLFQTAFKTHNYGRPIIGFPKTVKSFTKSDVVKYYRRWYTPKNIVFIAMGDFKTKEMLEWIRKEFSGFSGSDIPSELPPVEPEQKRLRVVVKKMNIQSAYLAMGYHIPGIVHEDVPAVDVLTHILGGTDSSRLEQEIKEKHHLAHNIYAYSFTPKDPGILLIGATLTDGDVPKAIDAIQNEIKILSENPVTSEELARAKLGIRSGEIYDKETVGGQGSKITSFVATAGSHEFEERYYQMIADVRAEDVRAAARKYLTPSNCTAVLIVPDNSKWLKSKAAITKSLSPAIKNKKTRIESTENKPRKIRLANGATMVFVENHNLPIVAICAACMGGVRAETKATNGISQLMARCFTKGTKNRSSLAIARDAERLAGHIEGFSGRNTAGVKCEFLSEHLNDGFSLFADVLSHPEFSKKEVGNEKRLQLKAIRDQEDALSSLAFIEFLKQLYPKHPYGMRSLGSKKSVSSFSSADVERFYKKIIRPSNMVITVSGDFNPDEIEKMANKQLLDLPKGKPVVIKPKSDPKPKKPQISEVIKKNKQQAHIVMGFQGTTLSSKDRHGMTVLNNILAGQGGRLFLELRDKMSLAYSVSSINHDGLEPGYFAVYIGTDPAKVDTAIAAIKDELQKVIDHKVSVDELERSKQYLVGTFELDSQRNMSLANIHTFNEIYGLGLDALDKYPKRIMSVTRDDVQRIAKRYLLTKAYTLAVVKP